MKKLLEERRCGETRILNANASTEEVKKNLWERHVTILENYFRKIKTSMNESTIRVNNYNNGKMNEK